MMGRYRLVRPPQPWSGGGHGGGRAGHSPAGNQQHQRCYSKQGAAVHRCCAIGLLDAAWQGGEWGWRGFRGIAVSHSHRMACRLPARPPNSDRGKGRQVRALAPARAHLSNVRCGCQAAGRRAGTKCSHTRRCAVGHGDQRRLFMVAVPMFREGAGLSSGAPAPAHVGRLRRLSHPKARHAHRRRRQLGGLQVPPALRAL